MQHIDYYFQSLERCLETNTIYYDILLQEIHVISKAYGWSREEIVNLSGAERVTWFLIITEEKKELLENTGVIGAISTVFSLIS